MNTRDTTRKSPRGRPFSDEARNQEIICLFRCGRTSAQIAPAFGLSPAGVCNVLNKYGVNRSEGGKEVASKLRKAELLSARSVAFAADRGADLAAFESLEQCQGAHRKYMDQQARARQRGIGWSLTFGQWWAIWCESGVWAMRGRSAGNSAVMARQGDTGPYSVSNVYITSLARNFVDSHFFRGHQIKGEASNAAVLSSCPSVLLNATQRNGARS